MVTSPGGLDLIGPTGPGSLFTATGGGLANLGKKIERFEGAYGGLRGFFSRTGEWIKQLPQEKFSAEQLLGQMKTAPIKKEEVQWLGMENWLKDRPGGKVTKAEIQDFIDQHQIRMEEKVLGDPKDPEILAAKAKTVEAKAKLRELRESVRGRTTLPEGFQVMSGREFREKVRASNVNNDMYYVVNTADPNARYTDPYFLHPAPRPGEEVGAFQSRGIGYAGRGRTRDEAIQDFNRVMGGARNPANQELVREARGVRSPNAVQYGMESYRTPGGRNYREILFKYPLDEFEEVINPGTGNKVKKFKSYQAPHFAQHGENTMAHVRVQDFKDTTGAKTLLVDELQSDWHREGRKFGYGAAKPEDVGRVGHGKYVPDAPFKSSWHELVMKGMLRDAVEKGYDKIAWTTGKTQQDRWSLTRHFPELTWRRVVEEDFQVPHTKRNAYGLIELDTRNEIVGKQYIEPHQLEDYVGQVAADDIRRQIETGIDRGHMRDVKSGGEWAENLYDRTVPDFMGKYVKQWGGKVEKGQILTKAKPKGLEAFEARAAEMGIPTRDVSWVQDVWSVTITPEMRASIPTKGQPLWGAIPFVADAIRRSQEKLDKYQPQQQEEDHARGSKTQTSGQVR